jgi:antitoxin component YwqK of YwqJK toxin-antitoxin module
MFYLEYLIFPSWERSIDLIFYLGVIFTYFWYWIFNTRNYVEYEKYKNGNWKSIGLLENGKPQDKWSFFYKSGQLKEIGRFDKGNRTGRFFTLNRYSEIIQVKWYDRGVLTYSESFKNGVREGLREWYSIQRTPYPIGRLFIGRIPLIKSEYYKEGNLIRSYTSNDGSKVKNGSWISLSNTNEIKMSEYYSEFYEMYLHTENNYNSLCKSENEGVFMSFNKEKVEVTGSIKNGIRNGTWVFYHKNGQLKEKGNYLNGKKDGKWFYFNENGEIDKDREDVDLVEDILQVLDYDSIPIMNDDYLEILNRTLKNK